MAHVANKMAHASHWNMWRNGEDFDNSESKVKESWARGVQWECIRPIKYIFYFHWPTHTFVTPLHGAGGSTKTDMHRKSPAAWRSLIEEWQTSGLTQKEFCARHAIAYSSFHYWSKKFREGKALPQPTPAFIPVKVTSAPTKADRPGTIELVMPDGRRVHFHEGADVGFLRALLS